MRAAISIVFSIAFLGACSGPMGPIPGDALEGEETPWPADWAFTDSIENVLLETNPGDPYSVTVWGVQQNGHFYIAGSSSRSNWVENIQEDNAVILSVEHKLYNALATEVTDMEEQLSILQLYIHKYEIEPDGNFIEDGGILFKLSPPASALSQLQP